MPSLDHSRLALGWPPDKFQLKGCLRLSYPSPSSFELLATDYEPLLKPGGKSTPIMDLSLRNVVLFKALVSKSASCSGFDVNDFDSVELHSLRKSCN